MALTDWYSSGTFLHNPKIIIVAAGVHALLDAYDMFIYFTFLSLGNFLAYTVVIVLIALFLNGNALVKNIWFLPAALFLFWYVLFGLTNNTYTVFSLAWKFMLISAFGTAAFLFVGLWVKAIVSPAKAGPVNEYAVFDPRTVDTSPEAAPAIGSADKLKQYKELLDAGAITQEEFDAKKKQILGL